MKTIIDVINNNEWEKRLPFIRQMKFKVLNELQALPTIHKVVNELEREKNSKLVQEAPIQAPIIFTTEQRNALKASFRTLTV
jgi:hypothetical protein